MHIRVLPFGVLKESLGPEPFSLDVPDGANVADLLTRLGADAPSIKALGIAVSVNAEYADRNHLLRENDEVGLLPPVSGGSSGSDPAFVTKLISAPGLQTAVALYRCPIESAEIIQAIKHAEDGAVVVFDGIVRNNSRGRQTLHLDYEAYEEMADRQMREIAQDAIARFAVRQVVIIHRLGRLHIGETSVLIVVATAHRAQAYEASRWLIDTLKKTVPIWKKETFVDGAVWADGDPFPQGYAVEGANDPAL